MKDKIQQLAAQYYADVVDIRRNMHAHPELSFVEEQTSKFIASKLDEFGIAYKAGYVKTGIVGLIEGKNPAAKTIALRADFDALPILEENDVPYKSQNEGVMHACGHDVHTSSLLGAARILHKLRDSWEGTIKLIFQPGEEKLPGGASLMIKEGVLENPRPSGIIGQHVYPELPAGKVGFKSGPYMASGDEIYVAVNGKGGHAALPHKNIDPVLITAHIITALQQIVSRQAQPDVPSVLSFGKLSANGETNIIPDKVHMAGTFRTFDEDWRNEAHRRMKKMAEGIAESMGGSCDFEVRRGYPFLVNEEAITERARANAITYLGADNVVELGLRMTAEDFAYYSHQVPGCFYRLGISNDEKGINSGLHTSTFDIDEEALRTSAGLMAWLAFCELSV